MFAKCSNPDCGVPFDYREGQLVRFCKSPPCGQSRADFQSVEHFWLCGRCSELYVLVNEHGTSMKVRALRHPAHQCEAANPRE